jgi:hypothetical protein
MQTTILNSRVPNSKIEYIEMYIPGCITPVDKSLSLELFYLLKLI